MTTTNEKEKKEYQEPDKIEAKQAKIMTLPLPQILDELENYIRRVDEAVKQAQTAAKESREAADQAKVSGEKAAEAARKAAEAAVAKVKEEAAKAVDLGNFYRVPSDNRDLNYGKYLESGSHKITLTDDYNSNNTKILSVDEIKEKLLQLTSIQDELRLWKG